jgi:hypothetical protein
MSEEKIDCEDIAKEKIDKSTSKMKKYQTKKRRKLLKRLENTYTNEETNAEMESNRNALTVNKNSSTLNMLYLVSGIIFLLLSALFSMKLWLRFDFDSFTQLVLHGERHANSRFFNMGKIIQITRKIDLESRGVIFSSGGYPASLVETDKAILSD